MRKVLHPEAEEKKRDRLQEMKAADLEKSESEKGRTGLRALASSFSSSSSFFFLCPLPTLSEIRKCNEYCFVFLLFFSIVLISFIVIFLWTFIERKNRTDFRDKRRIRELDRDRKNFHCFFYSEVSL